MAGILAGISDGAASLLGVAFLVTASFVGWAGGRVGERLNRRHRARLTDEDTTAKLAAASYRAIEGAPATDGYAETIGLKKRVAALEEGQAEILRQFTPHRTDSLVATVQRIDRKVGNGNGG